MMNLTPGRLAQIMLLIAKMEEDGILELLINPQFNGPEKYEQVKNHIYAMVSVKKKLPKIDIFRRSLGHKPHESDGIDDPGCGS